MFKYKSKGKFKLTCYSFEGNEKAFITIIEDPDNKIQPLVVKLKLDPEPERNLEVIGKGNLDSTSIRIQFKDEQYDCFIEQHLSDCPSTYSLHSKTDNTEPANITNLVFNEELSQAERARESESRQIPNQSKSTRKNIAQSQSSQSTFCKSTSTSKEQLNNVFKHITDFLVMFAFVAARDLMFLCAGLCMNLQLINTSLFTQTPENQFKCR